MNEEVFVYLIDKRDIIVSVSSNWVPFAQANGWGSESGSENVVGRLLWDFLQDSETQHLYEKLFERVRTGRPIGPIPYRCDSPQKRRFLKLLLSPHPDGQIEITSTIVRTEPRGPVKALYKDMARSKDLIRICSMCKKMAITQNMWVELEEGLAQMRLFEADAMPQLTHGMCPDCSRIILAELDDFEPFKTKESDRE